ncbi:MAG: RNA-dependent RNA polymerase [Tomato betanucleorhabdovirus 1]|uniref:RNA-directed RNA polymerase n=1 Tax=Tomato betanucleorhabdovirus 1 TaxID=2950850 RepID=A0AAE9MR80_9RHAB|nr:MAG: RNA-dependent RNA polymerase [Tomato betanucleorhabdovirus 1]
MESHWEQSMEWDQTNPENEDTYQKSSGPVLSSGSYHCKSALRDHESNMKLYLYKSSYNKLAAIVGRNPYTEEALLLLPDLWRCFYHGTHSLNRVFDIEEAREHSTGSPSFLRWADYTFSQVTTSDILEQVLIGEGGIWGLTENQIHAMINDIYKRTTAKLRRCLYLQYFLNLALVVMNFEPSSVRSDVDVEVPGVCRRMEDNIYHLRFNTHIWLYVTSNAVFFKTPAYGQILQKDLFLNLCDKISERINVALGSAAISEITKIRFSRDVQHPDLNIHQIVDKIIDWGDHQLYSLGNRAFDLISSYEAFCVSAILLADDPLIWDHREFQNNLLQEIMTATPVLFNGAQALLAIINNLPSQNLSEIHGLWRIWGHPIIDLEGGLRKMETTCLKQANVDRNETEVGHRTFKYIFAKNYFMKHHHYPLSNITQVGEFEIYREHLQLRDIEVYEEESGRYDNDVYLHKCLRHHMVIDEYDVRYRHSDWESVTFLQNFQIPQSVNLATMIKDKAISQTRSELIASIITRNSVFDSKNRRGVLKWLSEQTLRLKNFLGLIDEEGIPENDRIIGLYPKERELKTKARFFSLMSYKMRMYVTATEEILGKYLLPYFPMITMSDTLLNMIIRLYNMTTKIGAKGSVVTYSMNIDFSKWNQNMRERTNNSIFLSIDRVIGFRNLISRTHRIFRESYLYLCSGEYIPQVIRGALTAVSPWSRIGDESGKEGLRQKGWTITTVCDIVSLAFSHGVRIELIGGGDNQVLTVTISSRGTERSLSSEEQRTSIRERMVKFRNALAKKMSKRGLPLKLEETWISHRLLMYNKIMYLDGVPLPGRLKVISRMFSNSNEGILCLGGIMSTLGTGYQSLSSKDYDPILAWFISRWLTLSNIAQYYSCSPMAGSKHLDRAMLSAYSRASEGDNLFGPNSEEEAAKEKRKQMVKFTTKKTISVEDLFLICLYYHKVLGGPGIGTPLAYLMKGFPDPLSEALTFNYSVLKSPMNSKIKDKITCLTAVSRANIRHWEHLLEDPVAINHDAPSHGIAALRNQASLVMKSADIKNKAFRELISIGDTEYLRDLSARLCSPDSIEPRLLHDIVGSTIPGYVNTILSKVDQSTTLNKLAANVDVISSIYNSEMKYMMFLADKIKIRKGHTFGDCPTEDARGLRNHTWGKNIVGVTTPHPAAYLKMHHHTNEAYECDQNYISVLMKRCNPLHFNQRGPFRPYFGSYTAEKFKSGILASAYGDEDLLRRAIKIQKLLGWRYSLGSNMSSIIQGILRCVTNADPAKFLPTVEEITGDVEHRYHDMATKHGGIPSNLTRDLTYASCNTTTFIDHSKGSANETIHFQAAIIYCSMMASLRTSSEARVTSVFHFHETCKKCIVRIEHLEDDGDGLTDISLASCPANPLMFIEENEIPVHYHNAIAFHKDQEKRERSRGAEAEDPDLVLFDTQEERSSWLLLAYVSLLSGRMKSSAEILMLNKMSRYELIFLLRISVHLNMFKQNKPLSFLNLCDIKDANEIWGALYKRIMTLSIIMSHLQDSGSPIVHHADSMELTLSVLLENKADAELELLEGAVCKYQDPEYRTSRTVMSMVLIKSIKTCAICSRYWYNWSNNVDDKPCNIHMQNPPHLRYHMYSLDKLTRFAGRAKSPTEGVCQKRPHPSVQESIKRHMLSDRTHATRMRLSGFLYRKMDAETDIAEHLCCNWRKIKVVEEDSTSSQKVLPSESVAPVQDPDMSYVPDTIGQVINLVQTILMVVTTVGYNLPEVKLALEITGESYQIGIIKKAFTMLRDVINKTTVKLKIVLFVSDVSSLEDVNLKLLREIEYDLRQAGPLGRPHPSLAVVQHGEGSLDILQLLSTCHAALFTKTEDLNMINTDTQCRVFVDATSTTCYRKLAELKAIGENTQQFLSFKICAPEESVVFPYPSPIMVEADDTPAYISYDMTLRALDNLRPAYNTKIGSSLLTSINEEDLGSVARDLYLEYVGSHIPIVSQGAYESCRAKLASGLMLFALKSNRRTAMPWRVLKLLSLIIGLDILTSTNRVEMTASYSKICGTSFSRITYKEIILYRKGHMPQDRRSLVNWTSGSLGEDIIGTLKMMEERIECLWSTDRVPSRKVCI